jgi:hypothetical protein
MASLQRNSMTKFGSTVTIRRSNVQRSQSMDSATQHLVSYHHKIVQLSTTASMKQMENVIITVRYLHRRAHVFHTVTRNLVLKRVQSSAALISQAHAIITRSIAVATLNLL